MEEKTKKKYEKLQGDLKNLIDFSLRAWKNNHPCNPPWSLSQFNNFNWKILENSPPISLAQWILARKIEYIFVEKIAYLPHGLISWTIFTCTRGQLSFHSPKPILPAVSSGELEKEAEKFIDHPSQARPAEIRRGTFWRVNDPNIFWQ